MMKNPARRINLGDRGSDNLDTGQDRRGHQRYKTILRIAKLGSGSREALGIVRNVSKRGMMLEINPEFVLGDAITINLGDDDVLKGTVRWRRGSTAGIRFNQMIDVKKALAKRPSLGDGRTMRLPRITVYRPVDLVIKSDVLGAEVCDISLGGVRIKVDRMLQPGCMMTLLIPNFANISGTVRWQSGDYAGIASHKPVSIHDLMAWIATYDASLQPAACTAPSNPEPESLQNICKQSQTPFKYCVTGLDDAGSATLIAEVISEKAALIHLSTSRRFFTAQS